MRTTDLALLAILVLFGGPCAAAEPVLRTASTHRLRYYVYPTSRQPSGPRVPILVCLAGADADFKGTAFRFAKVRGATPILLVVPCIFSNANALRGQVRQQYADLYGESLVETVGGVGLIPDVRSRLAWDEEGLLAILRDLGQDVALERKVYLTGFSGGGHLAWWMTLRHPDLLAGVVPVCPNHAFWCVTRHDACLGQRRAPILVMTGARDSLRHSRIHLPMPPIWLTLILVLVLGVGAGYVAWRRWRLRWLLAAELGLVFLAGALVAGRLSGNDFQAAVAVEMVDRLGHPVEWKCQPEMGHGPAPVHVLDTIARWRHESGG
jgi:pimeloyl-ACP methyl ester carboxylesterase